MELRNPHTGEVKLTPQSQAKEDLRKQYKTLQAKGKPTTVAGLLERVELLEKLNGL